MEEQRPLLETRTQQTNDRPKFFRTIILNSAPKQLFLDTKLAIKRVTRLETARPLIVVMRLCSPVCLSYLDAGFEPGCRDKGFLTACCRLLLPLLAAACCLLK